MMISKEKIAKTNNTHTLVKKKTNIREWFLKKKKNHGKTQVF